MVIWKYEVTPNMMLNLPYDAQVLSVQVQYGKPQMWILLDPDTSKVARRFMSVPTGLEFEVNTNFKYIGTFLINNDSLVFHLFEVL